MTNNGLNLNDFGPNAGYVAELLGLYQSGSPLLDKAWVHLFSGNGDSGNHAQIDQDYLFSQVSVLKLIDAYRRFGHLSANINALKNGMKKPTAALELDFASYNFSEAANKKTYFCYGLLKDPEANPLNILNRLKQIYSSSTGYEYQHLSDSTQREWLRSKIEAAPLQFSEKESLQFLDRLIEAQQLDKIFHTRFIGVKRFSIQGAESLAVLLQSALNHGTKLGIKDITIAMAHRGRLNTMVSFAGKSLALLCAEFEDRSLASKQGAGDVKYHLGCSTEHVIESKKIKVTIPPNPSHLEFVNPVAAGMVRAKQEIVSAADKAAYAYISIHGDASFAGQGIVAETFNFSQLKGYSNLGTVHVIINNQIGFTTYSEDSRSTNYCSDLAKGYDLPVFHVNADDIEAVARTAQLALEFRQKFAKDVVIDLVCSRKFGHNEGDDPSFTQPLLYKELSQKASSTEIYCSHLISKSIVSSSDISDLTQTISQKIKSELEKAYDFGSAQKQSKQQDISTAISKNTITKISDCILPKNSEFIVHPKVKASLDKRLTSLQSGTGIDWGTAETLAYGSLMLEGYNIRLSGQDSGRGTFSHRHLELHEYNTAQRIQPLNQLSANRSCGKFEVYNSPLSEQAVLAFDFGYSVEHPNSLVLWEAQFGDFVNGAQVIIDQFITAAEQKWEQRSSIVLLLPHGFEGQGPEHSSAKLERFLQLCSNNNIRVANLSNGAQLFHLLRLQALSKDKKPLVLMSPKSMLRLPEAACNLAEFTNSAFQEVIFNLPKLKAKLPIIACTGKVYYTLAKSLGSEHNILRIEQLYPWPKKAISDIVGKSKEIIWVQEEPKNMGAFTYVQQQFAEMGCNLRYCGRAEAAGVATGSGKYHQIEESKMLAELKALL